VSSHHVYDQVGLIGEAIINQWRTFRSRRVREKEYVLREGEWRVYGNGTLRSRELPHPGKREKGLLLSSMGGNIKEVFLQGLLQRLVEKWGEGSRARNRKGTTLLIKKKKRRL